MNPALMRPWLPGALLTPGWSPFFDFGGNGTDGSPFPALNVWAEGDDLVVEAELPGVPMSALELSVQGDELVIAGERAPVEEEDVVEHRRERASGRFSRVVRLPVDVDAEKVQATLREGVLTVRLPRSEASRPRRIEVKSAG